MVYIDTGEIAIFLAILCMFELAKSALKRHCLVLVTQDHTSLIIKDGTGSVVEFKMRNSTKKLLGKLLLLISTLAIMIMLKPILQIQEIEQLKTTLEFLEELRGFL